MLEDKNRIHGK